MSKLMMMVMVLGAAMVLGLATTSFAQNGQPTGGYPPVAGGANGNPGFIPFQTSTGKTVQFRTRKIHGHMMVLVPMSMSCDVFHVEC